MNFFCKIINESESTKEYFLTYTVLDMIRNVYGNFILIY